MGEQLFIKNFRIYGLFGIYDVNIPFKSNVNIFVGENGLGKTTILNALNYIIQGDGDGLSSINFDKVELILGNDEMIQIEHDYLIEERTNVIDNSKLYHYTLTNEYNCITRKIALEIMKTFDDLNDNSELDTQMLMKKIGLKYKQSFPSYYIEQVYRSINNDKKFVKELQQSWEYKVYEYMKKYNKVIYLPTYRRIEEDFNNLIENSHDEEFKQPFRRKNNFSYLQFGMDDVQSLIDNTCATLKNNTNEGFKGMTSNLLTNYIEIEEASNAKRINRKNIDSSNIEIIFSRLADKIKGTTKKKIIELLNNETVIDDKYHRYLLSIIKELNNIYIKNKTIDDSLEAFMNVCNHYLVNKEVVYDKIKIECYVKEKRSNKRISLKYLSSGEKQILSLFSKIYLNQLDNNIILFDEPELSLSILWQSKLIPDIVGSDRCKFIIAITHSPFIFDNDYRFNTINIKDYIKIRRTNV